MNCSAVMTAWNCFAYRGDYWHICQHTFWISVFEHSKTFIVVTLSSGSGIGKVPTMQWGPQMYRILKFGLGCFGLDSIVTEGIIVDCCY